ncbi:MAG: protein phosphatase 2C domain-containing protein [Cyclobacteriaceae bacterium]|jgi:serine/threonine protein phosphatase PrpC
MKIYQLNKTGKLHETHTEDYVMVEKAGNDWIIAAVFDGCSSGEESFFASALYGKILRKSCKMLPFLRKIRPEFDLQHMDASFIGKFLLNQVFDDLKKAHRLLGTEMREILSTIILLLYNRSTKSAWVNISGDGYIVHNKEIEEIDQSNIPDYMAYHLDIEFDQWINAFSKSFSFENQSDISISTDGISKFYSISEKRQRSIDPVHFLLIDDKWKDSDDMLDKKFHILNNEHGLFPYDDLGMVRIIST